MGRYWLLWVYLSSEIISETKIKPAARTSSNPHKFRINPISSKQSFTQFDRMMSCKSNTGVTKNTISSNQLKSIEPNSSCNLQLGIFSKKSSHVPKKISNYKMSHTAKYYHYYEISTLFQI